MELRDHKDMGSRCEDSLSLFFFLCVCVRESTGVVREPLVLEEFGCGSRVGGIQSYVAAEEPGANTG